jgi:hypothetical protein
LVPLVACPMVYPPTPTGLALVLSRGMGACHCLGSLLLMTPWLPPCTPSNARRPLAAPRSKPSLVCPAVGSPILCATTSVGVTTDAARRVWCRGGARLGSGGGGRTWRMTWPAWQRVPVETEGGMRVWRWPPCWMQRRVGWMVVAVRGPGPKLDVQV